MRNGAMEVLLKLNQNMIVLFAIKRLRPPQINLWGKVKFFFFLQWRRNYGCRECICAFRLVIFGV